MEKETQTEDRCRKNFTVMSKGTKGNKKCGFLALENK